jgi:hypothetical protein
MLSSHTLPCLFLKIIVDTKKTRNTIVFDASILGAKTLGRKEAKNSFYT